MSRQFGLCALFTAGLSMALLSACNLSVPASPANGDQQLVFGPDGSQGGMGQPGGLLGLDRYLSAINLSADQQTQIQALVSASQPQPPSADAPAAPADLQALLTASTLDEAAVRAALSTDAGAGPMPGGNQADVLKSVYDLLTDDQRLALAAAIRQDADAQPPMGAQPGAPALAVPDDLTLTDDQQAALEAFNAALAEQSSAQAGGPVSQADLAAYFETGDATALSAMSPAPRAFPVDELLALAVSLSADQRAELFASGLPGFGGPAGGPGMAPPADPNT